MSTRRCGREVVDGEAIFAGLVARFGFPPSTFEGLSLLRHNREHLAIVDATHPDLKGAPLQTVGLVFIRSAMAVPKLTTQAAFIFGAAATRNVVDLDRQRAEGYLRRETLEPTSAELSRCTTPGQVLIAHDGLVLGLGYYRDRDGERSLESLFPRAWALAPRPHAARDEPQH